MACRNLSRHLGRYYTKLFVRNRIFKLRPLNGTLTTYWPIEEQGTTDPFNVHVCESVTELPVVGSTWPVLAIPKMALAEVDLPVIVAVEVYWPEVLAAVMLAVPVKDT